MFKYIRKHLDINLIKASLAFAVLYCVLFNSAVFIYKFQYIQSDLLQALIELTKDFVYNLVVLYIIFFGLTVYRLLFIIAALFLFITGALASYYLFFFSISPTLSIMPSIFGTESTEVYELVSARVIVWLVFSASVCVYSIKYFKIQTTKLFFTRILAAICLLIVINNIIAPKFSFVRSYFPIQYLHNSYLYFFGQQEKYTKTDISTKYTFIDSSDDDVIGVLVIGEAARYANFGINGYERETTPNLSLVENLVSYKARSCASTTYLSVPCMLSRFGEKDISMLESESSVLSILTKLGFETTWFGTQSITKYYRNKPGGSFYDEVNFHIIPGGSILMAPNSHDGKLLPHLEQNIISGMKKFLVLHTTGSHWNYGARYPEEFAKFKPTIADTIKRDAASCDEHERLNSYDNSILYTDFFLSSVINILKNKKAFMIYASDHGESLGECGRLTHGADDYVEEQRAVPFIVWFSDSYKSSYPDKWKAVKSLEKKEISHDYIFHTILDCLNIESEAVDKSLSLCRGNN
jgi:glucan phosphoethanolaminetransferase (alkaline phosphatase superfamily)